MSNQDEKLTDLASKLQQHYDEISRAGSVSVGIGDGKLYVYLRVYGVCKVLPQWMIDSGVPVEFVFTGKVIPANESVKSL